MLNKLEALRQKPKQLRNRYAFWTSLCVTLVIAAVWGTQLPDRFTTTSESDFEVSEESGSSFVHTLGEVISSFKSTLGNFRGTIEYAQETDTQKEKQPKMIDLRALVASSTVAKKTEVLSSTTQTVQPKKDATLRTQE